MADKPEYLTTRQAAAEYGFAEVTWKLWRTRGDGPPYVRFGNGPQARVLYPRAELEKWVQERTVYPGAER